MNFIIFVYYLFFSYRFVSKLGFFCHITGNVDPQRFDAKISLPTQIRLRIRILS
jgi:hypothetical protein